MTGSGVKDGCVGKTELQPESLIATGGRGAIVLVPGCRAYVEGVKDLTNEVNANRLPELDPATRELKS
jgi:hypothetical protein